jgi:hypothetical protein
MLIVEGQVWLSLLGFVCEAKLMCFIPQMQI